METDQLAAAASRLRDATMSRIPCAPVRDLIAPGDVGAAYAVQKINVDIAEAEGRRAVGWKIGLTSPAVQQQLGVDQPDFGLLFADCEVLNGASVSTDRLLQPRIEAEVAFVLGSDLPDRPVDAKEIRRATAYITPALEIVDSRIAGWDITIVDTVADNASSGLYVTGPGRVALADLDLKAIAMTLAVDGDIASTGTGAACLGDPITAVVWLANMASEVGRSLKAGDVVLSGALGPMLPARPGSTYRAELQDLGTVGVSFQESR